MANMSRYEIIVDGIVQGVGFRPFIHNLAESLSLCGWVNNRGSSVVIEAEGDKDVLDAFVGKIKKEAPVLSHIKSIKVTEREPAGYTGFEIRKSEKSSDEKVYISPDVSICADCERELFDRTDRRYLYPFINCTNCGPRFTIIKDIPYDRINTTMSVFEMCGRCKDEYTDPANRRYHAQPVSCYECGPKLELLDHCGRKPKHVLAQGDVHGDYCGHSAYCHENIRTEKTIIEAKDSISSNAAICPEVQDDGGKKSRFMPKEMLNAIAQAQKLLLNGKIVAIKGLGGYHLACNALDGEAVSRLRQRKLRDEKPFAVMARDYETALKYAYINEQEKELLMSEKKPIVLLRKRENSGLPEEIAPGNPYIGIMLPYTALHILLFHQDIPCLNDPYDDPCRKALHQQDNAHIKALHHDFLHHDIPCQNTKSLATAPELLVMTSGNISSEPICYKDQEAMERLGDVADYFLTNNREIHMRTDDSVIRIFRGKEYPIRRSRGYVPYPVSCEEAVGSICRGKTPSVLACGGELKNTFCINRDYEFIMSHHIGDLENEETLISFEQGIEHLKRLFNIKSDIIAYDLHPEYLSTKYALDQDVDMKKIAVQHHHAHIASCMAENNLTGDVIGVAFDGTGFGEDGHIWGGEFFTGSYAGFKREGHLDYIRMPGGEKAIKEPWRMAVGYIHHMNMMAMNKGAKSQMMSMAHPLFSTVFSGIEEYKLSAVWQVLDKNVNCPLTSSMGRLFDAAASLAGIRHAINYEGQAAIEFEHIAEKSHCGIYPYDMPDVGESFKINVTPMMESIIKDRCCGVSTSIISGKFHETIADIVLKACLRIRKRTGLNRVVLSGGVFQNMTLLGKSMDKLEGSGFNVFIHSRVPSNDGGISLGQAMIAIARASGS
jgi:hydrogenase maturation protein HypF